jgi:acetyltransferase-like isoleucine patch superfamily enzyme
MSLKTGIREKLIDVPLGLRLLMLWRSLKAAPARRRAIGRRSFVSPTVRVLGWDRVRIGEFTVVCDDSWFVVNHEHPSIFIGNHCCIGARNFFTSGEQIALGDFTLTAPGCSFLGAHHDFSDPWVAQIAAPVTKNGSIETGVNCAFGAGAVVLADTKIGHGSIIGAGSVVGGTIPPFSVVVGNPARVIKRFDPVRRVWIKAAEFPPELEGKLPDEPTYRTALEKQFPELRTFPGFASRAYGNM